MRPDSAHSACCKRVPARVALTVLALACAFPACADSNGEDGPERDFQVVFDDLEATVFSAWSSGSDDVWLVGADAGAGPLVLEYEGERWLEHDTGARGTLWWVSGEDGTIWMCGEQGLALRYTRKTARFDAFDVGDATLFGILPLASDDVWAVGGSAEEGYGVAYHFDGTSFSEVTDLPPAATEAALFKIWGTAGEDLWMVGLGGTAFRLDGSDPDAGWKSVPVPSGRRLFTVHGARGHVVAVGGYASGLIAEVEGDELRDVTPEDAPQLNGVWVTDAESALAAGNEGGIFREQGGDWARIAGAPAVDGDYHAVHVDPDGGEWFVGGRIAAEPYDRGLVVHRGQIVDDAVESVAAKAAGTRTEQP